MTRGTASWGARIRGRLERPLPAWRGALIVVVALALVVAAGVVLARTSEARAPVAARETAATEAVERAGEVVAGVFGVDRDHWQRDRERARGLLAEPLATSQRAALAEGPPEGVAAIEWTPLTVGLVRAGTDDATVLVVARVTVVADDGTRESDRKTVQADLVRHDGRWLLSGLDELR